MPHNSTQDINFVTCSSFTEVIHAGELKSARDELGTYFR